LRISGLRKIILSKQIFPGLFPASEQKGDYFFNLTYRAGRRNPGFSPFPAREILPPYFKQNPEHVMDILILSL
jgi:hypothetical protein